MTQNDGSKLAAYRVDEEIHDLKQLSETQLADAAGFLLKSDHDIQNIAWNEGRNVSVQLERSDEVKVLEYFWASSKSQVMLIERDGTLYVRKEEKSGHDIKLLKDIINSRDKGKAIAFLGELEEVLYCERDFVNGGRRANGLTQIQKCRRYLYGRSPQIKMLLEHIALIV